MDKLWKCVDRHFRDFESFSVPDGLKFLIALIVTTD